MYPPEGGKRVAYTRVSTAAKWTESKEGLLNWKASMAMVGMAKSKSLQARVASIVAKTQDDAYRENKVALKELVETATTVAMAQGRADWGTSFHEMSDLLDSGELDWGYVPDKLKGPLEAYRETMSAVKVLDSEVFVTVDHSIGRKQLRLAGSLDRIIDHPTLGPVVADVKTGTDEPRYPLGVMTQVAIYARGKRYRDDEFPGTPAFTDGLPNSDGTAWRKPLWDKINRDIGVLIHCPLDKVDGKYVCNLYQLDLKAGWENVLIGHQVQEIRKTRTLRPMKVNG